MYIISRYYFVSGVHNYKTKKYSLNGDPPRLRQTRTGQNMILVYIDTYLNALFPGSFIGMKRCDLT